MSRSSDNVFDAVVVGGGPAGLNAALVLGRARRRVLVLDAGEPRNAASHAMHGFLSRDGLDPAELGRIAHQQLGTYPTVKTVGARVDEVTVSAGRFDLLPSSGGVVTARKLLLAVGVRDAVPPIPGLAPMYGKSVFHCPYCDAWEVSDQPLAVISQGSSGFRLALLLLGWSRDVVLCSHGPSELDESQRLQLASNGVSVCEKRIARLAGAAGQLEHIIFEDGSSLDRRAAFFHGPVLIVSALPEKLGCVLTDSGRIEIDEAGRTSADGVFAAGDAARRQGQHPAAQVIIAAASGAIAAIALHQELMYEDVGLTPALPRP